MDSGDATVAGDTRKVQLRVRNLHKAFGGQSVLQGVSVDLFAGDVVLLRGDNGSGKTTLLNILTGNLEPESGTIELFTNGDPEIFRFPKPWWRELNPFDHFTPERVSREGVGRTWQDIRLFESQTLRDNIAIATPRQAGENPFWVLLRQSAVRKQEKENLAFSDAALEGLGLKGRENSSADRVSLGQSKRVAIARAVQNGAKVLFLDEPLAGLDSEGVEEILGLLRRLAFQEDVTLVIVEHVFNIPLILDLATSVWTLRQGDLIVESPSQVRSELDRSLDKGFSGWLHEIVGHDMPWNQRELSGGAVLSSVTLERSEDLMPVLEVEDLVVTRGKRLVIGEQCKNGQIRGLSFSLRKGELALLQAPNGWGKTTLLEAIAGIIPIERGLIRICGRDIQSLPTWERHRLGLALLQARNHSFPGLTVREVLRLCNGRRIPKEVEDLYERRVSDLSGGERQKVSFACSIRDDELIAGLLDEPFSALDRSSLGAVWNVLKDTLKGSALLVAVPSGLHIGKTFDN